MTEVGANIVIDLSNTLKDENNDIIKPKKKFESGQRTVEFDQDTRMNKGQGHVGSKNKTPDLYGHRNPEAYGD